MIRQNDGNRRFRSAIRHSQMTDGRVTMDNSPYGAPPVSIAFGVSK